ncbi:hypothetical protein WV31_05535 [Magnetospirillum sp. ME-1]|nr:hypothetical protein WV31_05535 [Magnetospirillum sp. ME-1]
MSGFVPHILYVIITDIAMLNDIFVVARYLSVLTSLGLLRMVVHMAPVNNMYVVGIIINAKFWSDLPNSLLQCARVVNEISRNIKMSARTQTIRMRLAFG